MTDEKYMKLALKIAENSNCKSRKVGAVLVLKGHNENIVASPNNHITDKPCPRQNTKSGLLLDKCYGKHAESEVIAECARRGFSTKGATLYCTTFPCSYCAKIIKSAGIKKVVYKEPYNSDITNDILQGVVLEQLDIEL